ncbi:MAG: FAD:protein FMN transferase [Endomicrobiia bacterium]
MDTYIEIKFYSSNKTSADEIFNKVFNEISRIENKFSIYKEDSIVTKINQYKNYKIDEETYNLISDAIFVSSMTNGAFDITILPLTQLWNINSQQNIVPSEKNILEYKNYVDYKKIKLKQENNEYFVKLLPPLKGIDLGGIAKGFAIKEITKILTHYGIKKFLINTGGDIYCSNNKIWKIGIQHPRKPFGEVMAILKLKNVSICTSGDYERFFMKNNVRYHHILNPKTGSPAKKSVSVTIVTKDPVLSDALSTGIFVTGYDINMLNKLRSQIGLLEYIIIDEHYNVFKSRQFANLKIHL